MWKYKQNKQSRVLVMLWRCIHIYLISDKIYFPIFFILWNKNTSNWHKHKTATPDFYANNTFLKEFSWISPAQTVLVLKIQKLKLWQEKKEYKRFRLFLHFSSGLWFKKQINVKSTAKPWLKLASWYPTLCDCLSRLPALGKVNPDNWQLPWLRLAHFVV